MSSTAVYPDIIEDEILPVVLDFGGSRSRAGFASLDDPELVIPSITGRPKPFDYGNESLKSLYVGKEAEELLTSLTICSPIERGVVSNWDDLEEIMLLTYNSLGVEPEDHPVLWSEHVFPPRKHQEKLAELFFETLSVPSLYIGAEAALSLYSAGKTCGLVLASGDGITHTVPIYDGYASEHSIERFPMGGKDVTEYLARILRERGYSFSSSSEMYLLKCLKENTGFVALDYEDSLQLPDSTYETNFCLPDGQELEIGNERFRCAEVMFSPSLIGKDMGGIHRMLYDSFETCDVDIKAQLYGHVLLSGGNTLFSGMKERMVQELDALSPSYKKFNVQVHPDGELATWKGGSVLGSLSTFGEISVGIDKYLEQGPSVLRSFEG